MPLPRRVPFLPAVVGLAVGVAAILAPLPCAADEPVRPEQYDPKAYPPPGAQGSLLLVGAATTLTWYGFALGGGLLWPDAAGADDLRIPVAGPFMALADTGCDADQPDCSLLWPVIRAILIGIDGVGQVGGLAVMGEAAFLPTASAKKRTGQSRYRPDTHSVQWRPVPFAVGKAGLGLGVVGRF